MFKLDKRQFILRSIMVLVGMLFLSFGAALSMKMGMGLDPFTAFNTGFADVFNISLGIMSMIVNALLVVFVLIFNPSRIGWGTIYTVFFIGYMVEFFIIFFDNTLDATFVNLVIRIILTIVAIAFFTFGIALIMDGDFGVSPYDAVTPIIIARTSWNYVLTRIAQDIIVILIAWAIGGPVGIATFITGFLAGPFIEFFSTRFTQKIAAKI